MKDAFEYQKPDREQTDRIERVRAILKEARDVLVVQCRPSRQLSVAITKLEEAMHWAVKSIVFEESA